MSRRIAKAMNLEKQKLLIIWNGGSTLFLFSVSWFLGAMQSYLQIILESLPADGNVSIGIHNQQAARLQELVEFILSQVCCFRFLCM
jgi:hypothetical protein